MIESFLDFLYIKTVGVSLLIAIILVLRPIILKTMNAKLAYQLWLIVPIFLLIPVIDYSNMSAGSQLTVYLNQQQVLPAIPTLTGNQDSSNLNILLAIWVAGFIASLFFYLFGCYQLKSSFKTISKQPQAKLLGLENFSSSRNLKFVESKFFNSPAVFGFLTANIILPKDFHELDDEQQQVILSHELHHVQRRDYQTNHIRNLVRCVFWFNPLVYLADKYFEADQELSCDLGVLQTIQSITTHSYAKVLVNEATNKNRTMLLSQWNYSSLIKERIKMLGRNKNKLWHKWLTAIFAVASIGYANLLVAGNSEKSETATPIVVVQSKYPIAAVESKIEGLVKFKFDLKDDGTPINLTIVNSEPAGVFDQVALEAIEKWRFKPDVLAKTGLFYTLEYKLSETNLAIPTKVIAPIYPRKAAQKGIEGSVTFNFDLEESGKPTNLKITNSRPEGVFEKEAKEAIKQWLFKSESGESENLQYTMDFRLNTAGSLEELKKDYAAYKEKRDEMLKKKEKLKQRGDKEAIESMTAYIAQLDKLIKTVEFEIAAASK